MKYKIGDVIKINMKKLSTIRNRPVDQYYLDNLKRKLKESRNDTLYVTGVNRDETVNVRSWQRDTTGDITIPTSVIQSMLVQGKEINPNKIQQMSHKQPPTNIQPGDYVQLDGRSVMGMINGGQILRAMKKCMNVMYVHEVEQGSIIVSAYKFMKNVNQKYEVPMQFVKHKLVGVQD